VIDAVEFTAFSKIPRLNRQVVITEKIDGTNAAVGVTGDGQVYAQSRKRVITPDADNFGFARWVHDHAEELRELGPGVHFGEWWGLGIQRGYGLDRKRFSLFNTGRWSDNDVRPRCCGVVPVLDIWGQFDSTRVQLAISDLAKYGSAASPGYMNPEGVVVFHVAANQLFKVLIENDELPKGAV
jgi:hypothetical protein